MYSFYSKGQGSSHLSSHEQFSTDRIAWQKYAAWRTLLRAFGNSVLPFYLSDDII